MHPGSRPNKCGQMRAGKGTSTMTQIRSNHETNERRGLTESAPPQMGTARASTTAGLGGGAGQANTDLHDSTRSKIPATIAGVRAVLPSRSRACRRMKL